MFYFTDFEQVNACWKIHREAVHLFNGFFIWSPQKDDIKAIRKLLGNNEKKKNFKLLQTERSSLSCYEFSLKSKMKYKGKHCSYFILTGKKFF